MKLVILPVFSLLFGVSNAGLFDVIRETTYKGGFGGIMKAVSYVKDAAEILVDIKEPSDILYYAKQEKGRIENEFTADLTALVKLKKNAKRQALKIMKKMESTITDMSKQELKGFPITNDLFNIFTAIIDSTEALAIHINPKPLPIEIVINKLFDTSIPVSKMVKNMMQNRFSVLINRLTRLNKQKKELRIPAQKALEEMRELKKVYDKEIIENETKYVKYLIGLLEKALIEVKQLYRERDFMIEQLQAETKQMLHELVIDTIKEKRTFT